MSERSIAARWRVSNRCADVSFVRELQSLGVKSIAPRWFLGKMRRSIVRGGLLISFCCDPLPTPSWTPSEPLWPPVEPPRQPPVWTPMTPPTNIPVEPLWTPCRTPSWTPSRTPSWTPCCNSLWKLFSKQLLKHIRRTSSLHDRLQSNVETIVFDHHD